MRNLPRMIQAHPTTTTDKPEWLTVQGAVDRFSISRAEIYNLISEGLIKSASIRKRGNVSGRRLISYDSLAGYIEGFVESPSS